MSTILENARREARRAKKSASIWRVVDVALGLPTAILAGLAGAAGLSSAAGRVPAAILALVAAALSAAGAFLKSAERAATAERHSALWQSLAADACLVAAFEGTKATAVEIRNQISLLIARQEAISLGDLDRAARLREVGPGRIIDSTDLVFLRSCATALHMPNWVRLYDDSLGLAQRALSAGAKEFLSGQGIERVSDDNAEP
ncbi:MAG: hypothetical protein ACRDRC_04345 [Pseudonocardiaceae bacterium]